MKAHYSGREVLITGGLGFLGSNLAVRLSALGANVTVIDSLVVGCGGNPYNIDLVRDNVRVLHGDIGRGGLPLCDAIRRAAVVFNLAGEISHSHSMRFPKRDAALNVEAQLQFLDECARSAPGVRVVYAGTRQVYGVPRYLPVDEDHPICPVDFNGIHKNTAAMYHLLHSRMGTLDAVVLNLSNVYGPRMALALPCQGFLANFVRKAITGQRLEVFGDGRQLRDPVYVDDAVEAFLAAGAVSNPTSRVFNVGGPVPLEIFQIAKIASREVKGEPPTLRPFPAERKAIDIGSYYADTTRIHRELGWEPRVTFEEGISRTFDYYRREMHHYLTPGDYEPRCELDLVKPEPLRAVAQ